MTATATASVPQQRPQPAATVTASAPRLPFVDGLRGIAALVVCVGHMLRTDGHLFTHPSSFMAASTAEKLLWPFRFGNEMVALFLLISAFSLVYSEDGRRARGHEPTSFRRYLLRRVWRIGPVYYLALAAGVVVALAVGGGVLASNSMFAGTHPNVGGTLAHLLFLHDARPPWSTQGNGPLWSLAYEAQFYLLLPALVWLMRRVSAVVVAVPLVIVAELSIGHTGVQSNLLTFFVLGAAVGVMYRRVTPNLGRWCIAAGTVLMAVAVAGGSPTARVKVHDIVWGATFALLLVGMATMPLARLNPFSLPILRRLGDRSYSLYALHFPVVLAVYAACRSAGLRGAVLTSVLVPVAVVAVAGVVEAAYRLVERPSLRKVRAV